MCVVSLALFLFMLSHLQVCPRGIRGGIIMPVYVDFHEEFPRRSISAASMSSLQDTSTQSARKGSRKLRELAP